MRSNPGSFCQAAPSLVAATQITKRARRDVNCGHSAPVCLQKIMRVHICGLHLLAIHPNINRNGGGLSAQQLRLANAAPLFRHEDFYQLSQQILPICRPLQHLYWIGGGNLVKRITCPCKRLFHLASVSQRILEVGRAWLLRGGGGMRGRGISVFEIGIRVSSVLEDLIFPPDLLRGRKEGQKIRSRKINYPRSWTASSSFLGQRRSGRSLSVKATLESSGFCGHSRGCEDAS